MAKEVREDNENGYQNALVKHVNTHTVGENARLRVSGFLAHNVFFRFFRTERKRRETVGNKVNPKQMHGL